MNQYVSSWIDKGQAYMTLGGHCATSSLLRVDDRHSVTQTDWQTGSNTACTSESANMERLDSKDLVSQKLFVPMDYTNKVTLSILGGVSFYDIFKLKKDILFKIMPG